MKKWLINNYLPMWAKEIVLAENKTLKKRNQQLEQEIAVLKAKIYGMETVQEWISVKDMLPEEDGKYLVFEQSSGRTNTSILRFAKDARKVDKYDFKGRWKNAWYEYDSEWGHYTVNSVTHWMPLPQPPKGE